MMNHSRPSDRRKFLAATGFGLSLPWLESVRSPAAEIESLAPAAKTGRKAALPGGKPRMVCIGNMLGFYPDAFWPAGDGSVQQSRTLRPLSPLADDLTVISGLDHGLKGGHFAIHAFLSGVRYNDAGLMPDRNMTVDQRAAESVSGRTRFNSLTVGSESGIHGGCQMSWTRSGTRVPPISGPQELFNRLFVDEDAADRHVAEDRFDLHASILDAVARDAMRLQQRVSQLDRNKLDEYFTSIRDVEQRLARRRQWIHVDKPEAPIARPKDVDMVTDLPLLYDLIALALQTDCTRVATLEIGGDFAASAFGFRKGYHGLSHHGQVQKSIEALITMETYQVEQFARFLMKLKTTQDGDASLLDQTTVLFGSGMGNANSHTNTNLPIVLAGGGFRHRGRLAFESDDHRPPMTNLFVSMLQQFGVPSESFATSTGSLRGLDWT
ncbi:MAG: DUF1552 domain-containing protein [Planctomycetota bacterium]